MSSACCRAWALQCILGFIHPNHGEGINPWCARRLRACCYMGPGAEDMGLCRHLFALLPGAFVALVALAIARRESWKGSAMLRELSPCVVVNWHGSEVLNSLCPVLCPSAVSTHGPRHHASFCPCRSRRTLCWCQNWAVINPGVAWWNSWCQVVLGEHSSRWQTQGMPGGSGRHWEEPRQPSSSSAAAQGAADTLEH